MFTDANNVLKLIKPGDRVLDVGGAIEVFPRANAVIDVLPYEKRHPGQLKDMPEQFTAADWYVGDICSARVWENFKDKEFDFVICSHTLEDIRDPIYVCAQLNRVAKAGYIECPSRFRECAKGDANDAVSGWEHHRWILDVKGDTLIFTPKLHWANQFDYLGQELRRYIADYHYQFTAVHWTGGFNFMERGTRGSTLETENQFFFYDTYPYSAPPHWLHTIVGGPPQGPTFVWSDDFRLPVEEVLSIEEIVKRYQERTRQTRAGDTTRGLRELVDIRIPSFVERVKKRLFS